jgi:hypothetical protein
MQYSETPSFRQKSGLCPTVGEDVIAGHAQTVPTVRGIALEYISPEAACRPVARCHDPAESWPAARSLHREYGLACRAHLKRLHGTPAFLQINSRFEHKGT